MAIRPLKSMTRRRQSFSLILPKIEQERKDLSVSNGLNYPNSNKKSPDKGKLNFPSLVDENNNCKKRVFKYKHLSTSPRLQRNDHAGYDERIVGTNTDGLRLHALDKSYTSKINPESTTGKLKREKQADSSPSSKRKLSQLQHDPRYVNTKFTIQERETPVRAKQTRVKNCSIVEDKLRASPNRLMEGIQKQDAFEIDRSIELGSIKKCCAWMDTWFTGDGRPKEQTDDEEDLRE